MQGRNFNGEEDEDSDEERRGVRDWECSLSWSRWSDGGGLWLLGSSGLGDWPGRVAGILLIEYLLSSLLFLQFSRSVDDRSSPRSSSSRTLLKLWESKSLLLAWGCCLGVLPWDLTVSPRRGGVFTMKYLYYSSSCYEWDSTKILLQHPCPYLGSIQQRPHTSSFSPYFPPALSAQQVSELHRSSHKVWFSIDMPYALLPYNNGWAGRNHVRGCDYCDSSVRDAYHCSSGTYQGLSRLLPLSEKPSNPKLSHGFLGSWPVWPLLSY